MFPGESNKALVNEILEFAVKKYLQNDYFVILEGILPLTENADPGSLPREKIIETEGKELAEVVNLIFQFHNQGSN